jgi:hypothetical protein
VRPKIKRREAGELRILAITLIASSTELLAAGLHGHTEPDIDAAIKMAVDLFANRGELPANAVASGVQHARDRILHREALMLCAVVMLNFYLYH